MVTKIVSQLSVTVNKLILEFSKCNDMMQLAAALAQNVNVTSLTIIVSAFS